MSLIDLHIAQKLKTRREELGIKRKSIANQMGVSYQQIQKYEIGKNRIPASRLYQLSQMLNVRVDYFFEGLSGLEGVRDKTLMHHETPKLLNAYFNIPQTTIRKNIVSLLETLGQEDEK